MTFAIAEPDWKHLRRLQKVALERFSQRILDEIEGLQADSAKDCHTRYLDIYELIHRRNKEMARAFEDPRRSRAIEHLAALCSLRLITQDEFAGFSQPFQEIARFLCGSCFD